NIAPENLVGPFGVYSTYWSYAIFGGATWLIPAYLFWLTYLAVRSTRRFAGTRMVVMLLSILACAGLWSMQDWLLGNKQWFPHGPGGVLGAVLYRDLLKSVFGVFGAGVLLITVYVLSILFILTKDIGAEFDRVLQRIQDWRDRRAQLAAERTEQRRLLKEQVAREKAEAKAAKASSAIAAVTSAASQPGETAPVSAPAPVGPSGKKLTLPKSQEEPLVLKIAPRSSPSADAETASGKLKTKAEGTATDTKSLAVGAAGKIELNIVKPEEPRKARALVPQSMDADYQFPPLSMLKEQVKISAENSDQEHRRNAENLLRILGEFGVEVTLGEIHVGPVITRYEVAPAAGVRVEKISGLDKNIALGMRAQSVRILAPIPGKAAVGVEVPNQHPTQVGLREILESEDWVSSKADIPIALGKDVSGRSLISDLTKMPHLLIAGATGSGKSVCINAIIASILYSRSPKDLRLLMVDPKVVELKVFNTLPHMLIPVVTEAKKVPAALKWLLKEMEQRYQIFAKCNVKNINGFNNRKRLAVNEPPPSEIQTTLAGLDVGDNIEIPDRLPYIVVFIDELADLMMAAPAEIETAIARLAQLARAAGIHLIIATQRPSVNVITGVIKANLPTRIAFQVASQVDSRTIIDGKGADTLIGRGDMLFTPPGTSRLVRAQGAYVSDEEISEIVEFLKKNGPPIYAQEVQAQIDRDASESEEDGEGGAGADEDLGDDEELYAQAVDVLKATRRASTSMLQRRLRIGYNRAARIMEIMEERGIVGPENGSSPREILVDLDTL
ncbi:MAG: DNA translocase FtsK 4TM domain-containing protein, partial [Opitutaceae bacterium]